MRQPCATPSRACASRPCWVDTAGGPQPTTKDFELTQKDGVDNPGNWQGRAPEAELASQLSTIMTMDALTQTHNRRYFNEALEREYNRSLRYRRSLSLMMSFISAAGRIPIVPHFNFTPGDWEMS